MEREDEAIVLQRFDWSESSQVLHVLTAQRGRAALLARGIKKPNGSLKGPADLFHRARIVYRDRKGAELGLLTRYEPITGHPGLRESLERLFAAFFLVELALRLHRDGDPAPLAYRLLARALFALEDQDEPAISATTIAAELGILDAAGFAPGLGPEAGAPGEWLFHAASGGFVRGDQLAPGHDALAVEPGTRLLMKALAAAGPRGAGRIRVGGAQRRVIRALLGRFHRQILDRPLHAEPFLLDPRHGRRWMPRPRASGLARG
jgi:DNA repair protein RecO